MEQVSRIELAEVERTHEMVTLVESDMATAVVEFGRSIGCTFTILPYRGVLDCPVGNNEWTYEPYTNQLLHHEAERRLFEVGCQVHRGIRILDIVYGHEVEDPLPEIEWKQVRKVTTTVLGALVVAAGIAVVATAAALTELDPCLILVLDDEEHTWVQICTWL